MSGVPPTVSDRRLLELEQLLREREWLTDFVGRTSRWPADGPMPATFRARLFRCFDLIALRPGTTLLVRVATLATERDALKSVDRAIRGHTGPHQHAQVWVRLYGPGLRWRVWELLGRKWERVPGLWMLGLPSSGP